ncbi:monocarboxylate transporter 12-like isoform X1 [Haliotis rubra]|uniref:monocarboxylate transporter 12-like isoform X1 n=1 Tax=Haliotis rubra TaxID=36100 RepID=UPI001EE5F3EB|nr:monocarboxylate transporter 12-like isoform X1 [Haliotis rubra]XP_046559485.1 monocarboxylate transporter 12-like isoform X1 [Haliotis rubra]
MEEQNMYSWVVVGASFAALLFGPSINYAVGVFYVALLNEFNEDITLTAWLGALFSCMFALTGPVASLIINVSDCRTCVVMSGAFMMIGFSTSFLVTNMKLLFITYALIAGLGTGLAQTGSSVILGYYFPKKAGLATGISCSGVGLGIFIHPPLVQYLLESYGFHGTFLIAGGITFHVCVAGMLMRPTQFERRKQHTAVTTQSRWTMCGDICRLYSVLSNVSFLFFLLSLLCFSIAVSTEYLFLPDFFIKQGSTFQEGAFVISVSGIGSTASRVLVGLALSDERIESATVYSSLHGIMAGFTLILPFLQTSPYLRILYGLILGLYTGGAWVLVTTLTLEILGVGDFAAGLGVGLFSCGTGYLIGPPIAGALLQASGYYHSVFIFAVAMFFAATLLGFLSTMTRRPLTGDTRLDMTSPISQGNTPSCGKKSFGATKENGRNSKSVL